MKKVVELIQIGYIYLFTNLLNGKKYVGQTKWLPERRWKAHRKSGVKGARLLFHRAIAKNGWENFKREVIWTGDARLLNEKETYYIKKHNSFVDGGWGYNLTRGGGVKSKSKLVIRKHRVAAKRRWEDPEERLLQSQRQVECWKDLDYRKRASDCQLGKKLTHATRKKISDSRVGKKADDGTRLLQSIMHKRRYAEDPSLRFRVGAGNRGKACPKSEATKQRMREAAARRWARPEEHERASASQRGLKRKPHSAETKQKMSATTKRRWKDPAYRAAHSQVGLAVAAANRRRPLERKLANAQAA